jgi:rare lipoprotein A
MILRLLSVAVLALSLAACGTTPEYSPETTVDRSKLVTKTPTRKPNVVQKKGGGYYKDDGPGDDIPDGLDDVPDAEPKWEPLNRATLRPYVVLGKEYVPYTSLRPYKVRGIASWYGKKFHGQKTSTGETYDMYSMSAAHTILPLPCYARVTNLQSGKSVIVRVNDRGPFHADRVMDLSYTAAHKLGLIGGGSGQVEVEAIIPGEPLAPPPVVVASTSPAPETAGFEQLVSRVSRETPPEAGDRPLIQPATDSKGIYLQLGAFGSADNAENLRNHLSRELDWLAEPMQVFPGGNMHRVQVGPYASRNDAERVAEKIRTALGYKPALVSR